MSESSYGGRSNLPSYVSAYRALGEKAHVQVAYLRSGPQDDPATSALMGAAVLIDQVLVYTDSQGRFLTRGREAHQHWVEVLGERFLAFTQTSPFSSGNSAVALLTNHTISGTGSVSGTVAMEINLTNVPQLPAGTYTAWSICKCRRFDHAAAWPRALLLSTTLCVVDFSRLQFQGESAA